MIVLFVGHIPLHIDIPNENQTAKCQQFFFATTELGILHKALHNADESFWVAEVCVSNFIKNNSIACANLADLTRIEVNKELCWCGFTSRENVGIVRDIAIEIGLARFTGGKFDHIVVVFNQRDTSTKVKQFLTPIHPSRINTT